MSTLQTNFQEDVDAISSIPIVPTLLNVICRTTGMGFAAIARVTENKWVACSVKDEILFGLEPGGELEIETTICHEIRQSGEAVVIDHVDNDASFRGHPTPAMYGFQSYISMPIIRQDGTFFGTLCAIDPRPAKLNNPETIGMFKLFAELISFHLNSIEELKLSEARLRHERAESELREQFIAILGHDLRNPLSATLNSAQLLIRMAPNDKILRIANIILESSYRINGLIENLMDLAQGRLGSGIIIKRKPNEAIDKVLNHAIAELEVVHPDRTIITQFDLDEPVNCDGKRIAQLFSNLLGNAVTHGAAGTPIFVEACTNNGEFTLSVANSGSPIPAELSERLFKPFFRGDDNNRQQGLGLGLYIAAEIADAHNGRITVSSTPEETRFTLRMPVA